MTKDGDLAGPRAVEHLVDTVLSFDGDRHHALRVLTSVKHRFGPTGEVGIFEMRDDGLRAVPDPGPLMLGDRMAGVPGSVVVPVLQGRRPLLVEVQALLGPGTGGGAGSARPHTLGIDAGPGQPPAGRPGLPHRGRRAGAGRVLRRRRGRHHRHRAGGRPGRRAGHGLGRHATAARAARRWSSFGELGLAGEVRTVPGADRRLAEAHRAGFTRALVPASTWATAAAAAAAHPGMEVHGVRTLAEALGRGPVRRPARGTAPGTMPGWSTVPAAASR